MTHLPECHPYGTCEQPVCEIECICDELRSCEQRVRKSLWQECYDAAMQTTERNYVFHEKRGYAAALDAAEQAVAMKQTQIAKELVEHLWSNEYPSDDGDCCAELVVNSAIAAIRALKEK